MNLSTGDRDETRTTTYFSSAHEKIRALDRVVAARASSRASSCVETRGDGGRARDIADTRGWGSFRHSSTLSMDAGVVYCVYAFDRCGVGVVVVVVYEYI